MATNWRYDYERQRYNIDFRRSIERRIEKERIREQILMEEIERRRIREKILAEEIVRRRILEEEVRRELMLEKETALQLSTTTFGSYSRIPPFLRHEPCEIDQFEETRMRSIILSPSSPEIGFQGSEQSPFHHLLDNSSLVSRPIDHRFEPRKEHILLAKPETTISGQKRKSPTREADHDEANNINSKKKPKEWNCVMCHVRTTSEIDLNRHMQGKKHRAKEAGSVAQEMGHGITALDKNCSSITAKGAELVVHKTCFGASPVAKGCKLSTEMSNTVVGSTSDPGVKMVFKADEKSSRIVAGEAGIAEKKNIQMLNDKTDPTTNEKPKDVESNGNGDTSGPQKIHPSAKSCGKLKLWCEMSQIGTLSAEGLSDQELYESSCAFPDVAWAIKENIIDENMLPKGAKETEKEGHESVLVPLKTQGTVHYCTDGAGGSNIDCGFEAAGYQKND